MVNTYTDKKINFLKRKFIVVSLCTKLLYTLKICRIYFD